MSSSSFDAKIPFVRATYEVVGFLLLSLVVIIKSLIRQLTPLKYKMKDVAGEIVLITGGGGGLGRLMAMKLANLGAIVVVWDINAQGERLWNARAPFNLLSGFVTLVFHKCYALAKSILKWLWFVEID